MPDTLAPGTLVPDFSGIAFGGYVCSGCGAAGVPRTALAEMGVA